MARRRRPSKRTLFRIHGWLGLQLGLLLFIVCFSGAVATVSHEIDWLLNPAIRADSATPPSAWPWERWRRAVRAEHPGAHVSVLEAPPGPGWAARATVAYGPSHLLHVYLHPETGDVQGTFSHFNVARFFRSFHKQFYIYPGALPHGVYVVGPLAVVLLLSAVTALTFYRIRWSDLLLRQRPAGPRTFWSSAHRAGGVWTLPFTLVFAVTGIWYLVERAAADAGLPIGRAEAFTFTLSAAVEPDGERLDLDACVDRAQEALPALDVRTVLLPRREGGAISLFGRTDAWLVRGSASYVVIDPYRGAVLRRQDAADLAIGPRLIHTADPLHFGTFGGLPTKLLWLGAGLIISISVLTGVRIWWLRTVQDRRGGPAAAAGISRGGLAATLAVLALTTYGSVVNVRDSVAHGETRPYVWIVVGAFVLCTALASAAALAALRPAPSIRRAFRRRAPNFS